MSRQVLVETYEADGIEYGRVFRSSDVLKIQAYAHEHTESLARDFLVAGAPSPIVAGFAYDLAGGLELTIAPGHVVDSEGRSFDIYPEDEDSSAVMPAANVANPRIDLVVAVLAADQEGVNELLPHRRLLTQLEYEQDVPEYDPENINVPTERRNTVTIAVRQGVAAVNPVAPAAGAGEVALYRVRVEAGAVAITADKVTDVRPLARSLYNAWGQIDAINASPAIANLNEAIDDRVNDLFVDSVYFTKAYNDAGNLLTLDADLAAFDARYVNVTGDTMTGQLNVVKLATDPPAGDAAFVAQNATNGNNQTRYGAVGAVGGGGDNNISAGVYGHAYNGGGNNTSSAMGVRGRAYVSHYDANAYGGYFEGLATFVIAGGKKAYGVYGKGSIAEDGNTGGVAYGGYFVADNSSTTDNTRYGVYATTSGAGPGTAWAGYFAGNVNVTGTLNVTMGEVAAAVGAISTTVTWNNAGVTFTHWKMNVTNTASAAASLLADWQVGGVSQFSVRKDGLLKIASGLQVTGNSSFLAGSIFKSATVGLALGLATGSSFDFFMQSPAGTDVAGVPTGTTDFRFFNNLIVGPIGALATSATNGFLYISSGAGAPSGVPTAYTGKIALYYDAVNHHFYAYSGAWRKVALA